LINHKWVCGALNRQFLAGAVPVAQINIENLSKFLARLNFSID